MGLRFRKSIKIAPGVRATLTPKGVGVSMGGKMGRVSRSATGRTTLSASLPGTEISWSKGVKSSRGGSRAKAKRKAKEAGARKRGSKVLSAIAWALFLLLFIGIAGSCGQRHEGDTSGNAPLAASSTVKLQAPKCRYQRQVLTEAPHCNTCCSFQIGISIVNES